MKELLMSFAREDSMRLKDASLEQLVRIAANSRELLPIADAKSFQKPLLLAEDVVGFGKIVGVTTNYVLLIRVWLPDGLFNETLVATNEIEHAVSELKQKATGEQLYLVPIASGDSFEVSTFNGLCLATEEARTFLTGQADRLKKHLELKAAEQADSEQLRY